MAEEESGYSGATLAWMLMYNPSTLVEWNKRYMIEYLYIDLGFVSCTFQPNNGVYIVALTVGHVAIIDKANGSIVTLLKLEAASSGFTKFMRPVLSENNRVIIVNQDLGSIQKVDPLINLAKYVVSVNSSSTFIGHYDVTKS